MYRNDNNGSVIFYSFYTLDTYYSEKAKILSSKLEKLNVDFQLDPVEIPEGLNWPDICRRKIGMFYKFYLANPGKKVIWVDVDCEIDHVPDMIINSSADVIGFQRGFGDPLKIGYHFKSRFWEPCFLGVNSTDAGKRFLEDAYLLEQNSSIAATDDFFFEESWRLNAGKMSFQVIPASMKYSLGKERTVQAFFGFGSSGNVKKYMGSVVQHKKVNDGVGLVPAVGRIQGVLERKNRITGAARRLAVRLLNKFSPRTLIGTKLPVRQSGKSASSAGGIHSLPLRAFRMALLKAANSDSDEEFLKYESKLRNVDLTDEKYKIFLLAKAIFSYRHIGNSEGRVLPLCWWINPAPGNYGDWLSPYIFSKLSGASIKYINPARVDKHDLCLLGIGSIAKFARKGSIVLGSGLSRSEPELDAKARYRMVRGPLTREVIVEAGAQCPEVYGDPALVLPRLYQPSIESRKKSGKIALVRHFTHKKAVLALPDYVEEVDIFRALPSEIEAFIDDLHCYDGVVCTALHAYITSQAYGLPCVLATFDGLEDAVHGDGMKYADYFKGAGLEPRPLITLPRDLRGYDLRSCLEIEKLDEKAIDRMESTLRQELSSLFYDSK